MPELGEQVYCPEQISVPPSFPFLLKQYAKAAIRSQPTDLLKWSTAYFRCLSLNIPPPVKPRLEYPIAKDYCGITPGWLKALLHQLQGSQTLPFKVLWDRWTGACLDHKTLIQILCLGSFDNPNSIPWLKFLGLCAAHLTENLTYTMILICETLTEEPEGGSAMIPLDVFLDLDKVSGASSLEKSDNCRDPQELSENIEEPEGASIGKQKESSEENVQQHSEEISNSSTRSGEKELQKSQASGEGKQEEIMDTTTEDKNASDIQEVDIKNKEPISSDIQNAMNEDSVTSKDNPEVSEKDARSNGNSVTSDVKSKNSEKSDTVDPVQKPEGSLEEQSVESEDKNDTDVSYEEIDIAAVPGIGPAVPEELIQAVCEYMERVSATQRVMSKCTYQRMKNANG
nr:unnamed protein product [Callosobruchus chinensis]